MSLEESDQPIKREVFRWPGGAEHGVDAGAH